MTGIYSSHRSHVSAGEANSRGWSRPLSASFCNYILEGNNDFVNNYVSFSDNLSLGDTKTITTSGTGDYCTWGNNWVTASPVPQSLGWNQQQITVKEIIKEKVVTKQVEMRTLYKVYVVDPRKGGRILLDGEAAIAGSKEQAMLKAGVRDIAVQAGLDVEDVDVYIVEIGTFIRPKKSTQRVKVVKEDED